MGVRWGMCVLRCRKEVMKEILASNTITKYLAGLTTKQEATAFEEWLNNNPQYRNTVRALKQRVEAAKIEELMVA